MRIRAAVVTVLLLPIALQAQHLPNVGVTRRGPTGPQPLPPQPGQIARQRVQVRLPLSFESYPFLSYVQAPPLSDNVLGRSSRVNLGAGMRVEYRVSRFVSLTGDVTSSASSASGFARCCTSVMSLGSMNSIQTAEFGTRLRPDRPEWRAHPFVDLRVAYVLAYEGGFVRPFDVVDPGATAAASATRSSHGRGGVAGAGMEYALTQRFSLMTEASVLRSGVTSLANGPIPGLPRYNVTTYRITLGVKFNPTRMMVVN